MEYQYQLYAQPDIDSFSLRSPDNVGFILFNFPTPSSSLQGPRKLRFLLQLKLWPEISWQRFFLVSGS